LSRRALGAVLAAMAGLAVLAGSRAASTDRPEANLAFRAYMPEVTRGYLPAPTPTAVPTPAPGVIVSLDLPSASLNANWPVEVRDTYWAGDAEFFEDPSAPQMIAWYARFGRPGAPGTNSILAAHVDYVGFGKGPFGYLTSAAAGDELTVALDSGTAYGYTVKSVAVVSLQDLDMDAVVYPWLDAGVERVTLISCGGTFVPYASGGGEYTSRVILVAERYVD
jgi:hypothetical protein